jgi:hypothetical protein
MPEPTPPVAAERPAEPLVYRPLSGLAIAGLACAALYAGLLLLSVVVAFIKNEPFYLASWLLVLPVAGGILCLLALRQIRGSEGTRAGAGLARCGLWLAVIAGLGSATFSTFTGLAVRQQSDRFLMEKGPDSGFFPLLQAGDTNSAFLLTLPPNRRQANPHNEREMEKLFDRPEGKGSAEGLLTIFRGADFVRVLQQPHEPPPRVQALGVKSWEYEGKGYKVERTYRITTPEGEFDLPVVTQSVDSEVPGEGRKWMVLFQPPMKLNPVRLTDLGLKMDQLRLSAATFVNVCLAKLATGEAYEFFLDTRPPGERMNWRFFRVTQVFGLAGSVGGATPGGSRFATFTGPCFSLAVLPGVPGLAAGKHPLVLDRLRVKGEPGLEERVRRVVRHMVLNGAPYFGDMPKVSENEARLARWEKKDGRLELSFEVRFGLTLPDGKSPPGAVVSGRVVVSTDADASGQGDPGRLWRLERFEFDWALPMMPRSRPEG